MSRQYLILPHLKVNGANAMSCLYAIGFPSVTAFLGFGHALTRQIPELHVKGMGVIVHQTDFQAVPHATRPWALKAKKFPFVKARKPQFPNEASADSFQVRGYVHLDVSLILECSILERETQKALRTAIRDHIQRMRLAGGTIVNLGIPEFHLCSESDTYLRAQTIGRKIVQRLMPGYALLSRADTMKELAEEGRGDALDRILYAISGEAVPQTVASKELDEEKTKRVTYRYERHFSGWLVPLAVGFHDLSGNLHVKYQRSDAYEHHFVEPLVGLCEFRMPHHLGNLDNLMWRYAYDATNKNYLCINQQTNEKE